MSEVPATDYGLGKYIDGYTDSRENFNYKQLWWLLLPVVGWLFLFFIVLGHLLNHIRNWRVLLYENGIVKQTVTRSGNIAEEEVINFNDVTGISCRKTRNYQSTYGITAYTGTDVDLRVLFRDGKVVKLLSGSYKNEHDFPDKYNFIGYVSNAIINLWHPIAVNNFNREMAGKGYGTFHSDGKEIQVGSGFLRMGDNYVSGRFHYGMDSGMLTIQPDNEEGAHFSGKPKSFSINVNNMYNNTVFYAAISQFLGIK